MQAQSTLIARCGEHGRPAEQCDDCYQAEVAAFGKMDRYSAYVNEKRHVITTWPGHELASLSSVTRSRLRYTPSGGAYRMRYVTAIAPDGTRWHGRGSDEWDLVSLRRCKI